MKTSEILRKAIDNHLSSDKLSTTEYLDRLYKGTEICYLCWAILFAAGKDVNVDDGLDYNVKRQSDQIRDLIHIIDSETGFILIDRFGVSFEEIQQMRFMYADFLAYYFEDFGD